MQRFFTHNLLRLLAVLALIALAPTPHAAELGDIAARSYIGQPLSADVELLAGDGGPVQARLAQLDVYRGANITMNPALASVKMAVVRRDGKDVLHISTAGVVNADYVHVYVELTAGGRRDIRLATVWLQPDPNPAPPPVRVAPAVTAPAVVAAAEPAKVADSAAPAAAARLVRDRTRPAPMPSFHESEVGGPGGLKAAAAQARPPSLVPVRDIPERISEALGSRVIAPAKTAEKPALRAAGTPVSSAATVADKPRSVAAETPPPQVVGRPVGNGATKPTDKPAGAGDPKLTDKRAGAGTPQSPGKPAVIGAPELAETPAGAGPHKSADKPAAGLASKADTRHGVKPEAVVAGPGASQLAITATAAPPPQVAQALLPMPPLPLPAGVKKNGDASSLRAVRRQRQRVPSPRPAEPGAVHQAGGTGRKSEAIAKSAGRVHRCGRCGAGGKTGHPGGGTWRHARRAGCRHQAFDHRVRHGRCPGRLGRRAGGRAAARYARRGCGARLTGRSSASSDARLTGRSKASRAARHAGRREAFRAD